MSSELTPQDREILTRYLNRKNTQVDVPPKDEIPPITSGTFKFTIDNLVKNGKTFYNNTKVGENYVGLPLALEEAQKYIQTNKGIIATMPYLIAGKTQAIITDKNGNKTRDDNNYLWKNWLTTLSEEYIGIDEKGVFTTKGKPVLITLHGGGILTPERIKKAYADGLTSQNAANLEQTEFNNILKGVLPNNEKITMYTLDDVRTGIKQPFGKYAVITKFDDVKSLESRQYQEKEFLNHPVVLMRAGTRAHLKEYYNLAHDKDGVGCYHRFSETDPSTPSGRLLFLDGSYNGLIGSCDLDNGGRFVGVAPEAHRAKK